MRSTTVLALAGCSFVGLAQGAGFGVIEQSASGLGAAFAGSAAQVNDASVQYFNPAGLALLSNAEVSAAIQALDVQLKFTDAGSALPPAGLGQLPRGATTDDAGDVLYVPNLHVALPLSESLTAGLSVSVPYGLKTDYSDPWVGRFQGIFSELKTININPALGWQVNERLAVGVGVSYQIADAELTNAVMLGAGTEGRARLSGDDKGWGWNAGVLLLPREGTRLGLGYRSKIDYRLSGEVSVTTLGGTPVAAASGPVALDLSVPEQAYLSLAQAIGPRFTLLADASYTRWGRIGELRAVNPANGATRDVLTFAFDDAWRFALGGEWVQSDRWTFRAGVARDASPVNDSARTVRLPDEDRTWFTVGAQWRATERFRIDAAYARIIVADADVAVTRAQLGAPASFTSIARGSYDSSVNIFSLQLSYSFGK
jgi:long-chain fatty acid transport protein